MYMWLPVVEYSFCLMPTDNMVLCTVLIRGWDQHGYHWGSVLPIFPSMSRGAPHVNAGTDAKLAIV